LKEIENQTLNLSIVGSDILLVSEIIVNSIYWYKLKGCLDFLEKNDLKTIT
jgi:hypothetical protein